MQLRYILVLIISGLLSSHGLLLAQNGSKLIVNEILADPAGSVELGDSNRDGVRSGSQDEFVELANASGDTLDLTGWMIGDDESINFRFPDGYLLPPRGIIVIFGGGDVTNATGYDADPLLTRAFSADSTVGNGFANGGDFILIISPDSSADAWIAYGGQADTEAPPGAAAVGITFEFTGKASPPGNMNTSLVRNPDGEIRVDDPFVLHNEISEAPHSPATATDGSTILPKLTPPVTLIINEVLADPASSVELGDANMDGTRSSRSDEFIELANAGPDTLDLTGWKIGDDESINWQFPDGYKLAPREMMVIFGNGDVTNVPGYDADPLKSKVFHADSTVGNGFRNGGDIIMILSADGSYDMYFAYGDLVGQGGPAPGTFPDGTEFEFEIEIGVAAGADNSVTRFPDGDLFQADPFVQHLSVSENPFSPGQTIDGKFLLPKPSPPITVLINEFLADPGMTAEDGDANKDGTVDALQDQFVEIVNTTSEPVDLSGWHVGDGDSISFTFPDGYAIAGRAIVAVFGGGDVTSAPGYAEDPMATRVFVANGSIGDGLDSGGDHVVLHSADGSYDSYLAYGSRNGMGAPGGAVFAGTEWEFETNVAASADMDNSVTRNPDAEFIDADPFVQHRSVSDLPFSPAQTIEGLPNLDAFVDVPHPWGTGHAVAYNYMERDRIEVRDAAQLVPVRMDSGTVELWFRPDTVIADNTHPPDFTYLFSKNVSGNVVGDLGITWPRGVGRVQFFIQDGSVTQSVYSHPEEFGNMFFPRWYHIACSWAVGDSMRMYVDGQLTDVIASEIPLFGGEQMFAIGNGAINLFDSRFEGFRGMIDEVRFSLNVRYRGNSFELPSGPFDPDQFTLALWHMDEGQGITTEDATGNGFLGYFGGTGEDSVATRPEWVDISAITGVDDQITGLPEKFTLSHNYPNPFNPSTQIDFTVPRSARVEIAVYNILGQKVKVLMDNQMTPGSYTVNFDGRRFASGMYFYVMQANAERIAVRKMMLVK